MSLKQYKQLAEALYYHTKGEPFFLCDLKDNMKLTRKQHAVMERHTLIRCHERQVRVKTSYGCTHKDSWIVVKRSHYAEV